MTQTRVIRYRCKPECVEENLRLIHAVFDELAESAAKGLHYEAFRLDDEVTFLHVATIDADNPLEDSPAFAAFQSGLGARLEEGPVASTATIVGSYGVTREDRV